MTLRVGDELPELELPAHHGGTWRADEHRGRPLLLIFHRHLA